MPLYINYDPASFRYISIKIKPDHISETLSFLKKKWAEITPVQRGDILHDIALAMRDNRDEIAAIVAAETGMSIQAALGETGGAIAQGEFMAGEGRRFFGRTTTSAVAN